MGRCRQHHNEHKKNYYEEEVRKGKLTKEDAEKKMGESDFTYPSDKVHEKRESVISGISDIITDVGNLCKFVEEQYPQQFPPTSNSMRSLEMKLMNMKTTLIGLLKEL